MSRMTLYRMTLNRTIMHRIAFCAALALVVVSEPVQERAFARGFGGGFGGGFHGGFGGGGFGGGGFGGFRGGGGFGGGGGFRGFGGGGYGGFRGGDFGGFNRGNFGGEGFRGGDSGGFNNFRSGEGGFGDRQSIGYRGNNFGGFDNGVRNTGEFGGDAGRWNGGSVNRSQLNSFLGLPTDGGLGAAGSRFSNRAAQPGTFANQASSALHNNPYGTHSWSQTYAHSQGNNVQNWANNHPNATNAWNSAHSWAWTPYGADAGLWAASAWDFAGWPTLSNWLGWDNVVSYPYNYGDYITYNNNEVYYGSQPAGTAEQYYQEASTLADTPAPAPAATGGGNPQWLPLGIFGLVQGEGDTPTLTFQIAVDKQGTIRGNSSNQYGDVLAIQGAVDKRTQRVCWTVGTDKTTVYDTGLDNLTKSESPILVHTGPKHTQQEMLVRLKKPAAQSGSGTGAVSSNK